MESAFKRPAWVWDDRREEPVEIDPDDASRDELAEALENTRREVYELELELTREVKLLRLEVEQLQGTTQSVEPGDPEGGELGGENGA